MQILHKKDSIKRYIENSKNESWMERERLRGREKFKRLGYKNRFKKTTSICKEESNISRKLRIIGYCTNGKEAHHWNYNLPYSIFLLSRKAHKCIHKYISVNYSDRFCYTLDGIVIDTIEKAKTLFRYWLDINNINEELVHININSSITQKNLFNRND